MPYNEFEQQAQAYFENGKAKLGRGDKAGASSDFNMARAIAVKESLHGLISLIDSYLRDL